MPRTSAAGPAVRKISGENCRTISSRGRTHCPSGRPALMASWLIARRWDGIWGAKRSHAARTIPPLSWASANRRGTNRNGCAPSSAASRSTGTASASAGSWARTRVAETRSGSSDVSLASNSSRESLGLRRRRLHGLRRGVRAGDRPAGPRIHSGRCPEPRGLRPAAAGTPITGRRAASRRGSIEVTMDVTVVAPRGRVGAMGGLSNIGLPTVTEASTGFSTGVRPVGAGAENGGVLGEGTGRRASRGLGTGRTARRPAPQQVAKGNEEHRHPEELGQRCRRKRPHGPRRPMLTEQGENGLGEHAEKQVDGP